MENDLLRELSALFAQAGFENEHEQDSDNFRSQNPVNCATSQGESEQDEAFGQQSQSPVNCATSILGKRKHPEDKVVLSQSPYAKKIIITPKKIKITHTEQVKKNKGAVNELPRSRSAGF
jgi:hypothetical protein